MTASDRLRTERRTTIRRAAYQLADSGGFADWEAIEPLLCVRYGVIETRRLLADLNMRTQLNWRCVTARRAREGDIG